MRYLCFGLYKIFLNLMGIRMTFINTNKIYNYDLQCTFMWVTKLDVVFTEPDINAVQCLQEAFTFPQESRGMMKWDNTEDIVIVFRSLSKKQCHKWNFESCVRLFINVRACCILHKPTNCFHWNIETLKKLKLRYYLFWYQLFEAIINA